MSKLYFRYGAMNSGKSTHLMQVAYNYEERGMNIVIMKPQIDSKGGEYRMLVIPKKGDDPWPKQLRMGSGVVGWVMLDNVPIWYEVWRQLNAFPANLKSEPEEKQPDKQAKKEDKK